MIFTSFSKAENAAPGFSPSPGWKLYERGMGSMGRGLPRAALSRLAHGLAGAQVEGTGGKPRFRILRRSQEFTTDLAFRVHSASPGVHPGTSLP